MSESEEELSSHELLKGIMEKSIRAERHRRIAMYAVLVIAAAVVLALILVVPRVLSLLAEAQDTLQQADTILEEIQPAARSFSSIDFEGLNSSIETLEDTIAKLSGVMSIFGR